LQSHAFLYNVLSLQLLVISIVIIGFGEMALAEEQLDTSYIPRAVLFVPAEVMAVKISPDSKTLAYVKGESTGVMNLHIFVVSEYHQNGSLVQITHFTTPEIYRFFWTDDSKHIVFLKDNNGSKSYQLYSINVESRDLKNHTAAFKAITAKIFKVIGHKVAVGINDRNPNYHDIFILDTSNDSLTKIFENDRFSRSSFHVFKHLA